MFVSGVVGWSDVKQLQFCDGGLILNLKNNVQKKSDTFRICLIWIKHRSPLFFPLTMSSDPLVPSLDSDWNGWSYAAARYHLVLFNFWLMVSNGFPAFDIRLTLSWDAFPIKASRKTGVSDGLKTKCWVPVTNRRCKTHESSWRWFH